MLKQHKITAIISAVAALLLAVVVVLTCLLIAAGRNAGGASSLSPHEEYYNNKCLSYSVQNVNLAKGQIVFVGDSITDLYVLDDCARIAGSNTPASSCKHVCITVAKNMLIV